MLVWGMYYDDGGLRELDCYVVIGCWMWG